MPYNLSIPGQVSEFQLRCIELVAQLVPSGGHVVEVGSLFGRSSHAWASSVPSGATVHAIDPWQGNRGVAAMETSHGVRYGIDAFRHYTAECRNIEAHQGFSPKDFLDWSQPIDLYYEDAVHTNPVLRTNLDFWVRHLRPEGVVCGDDYRPRFPDVVCEVNSLAARLGRELIVADFFWCLLPRGGGERLDRVRDGLRAIAADARRADRQNPAAFTLELASAPERCTRGAIHPLKIRLTNETKEHWYPWFTGHAVVLRLVRRDPAAVGGTARLVLDPLLFPPDIGRECPIDLVVPADAAPGVYELEMQMVSPMGEPLRTGRIGRAAQGIEIT